MSLMTVHRLGRSRGGVSQRRGHGWGSIPRVKQTAQSVPVSRAHGVIHKEVDGGVERGQEVDETNGGVEQVVVSPARVKLGHEDSEEGRDDVGGGTRGVDDAHHHQHPGH